MIVSNSEGFFCSLWGLEGHPCRRAQTGSLSDPHFLYSSESTLTLKDVPSTLQSLVAVIAQHASQKAKLKGAGEGRSVLSVDYLLLNPEVFPHCVGVFQDVSVSKKRKRHLVCWNIIYVRFEKVVMA